MDYEECERLIHIYLEKREVENAINAMVNRNEKRLIIDLDKLREYNADLVNEIIKRPSKVIGLFEDHLNSLIDQDEVNQKVKDKQKLTNKTETYKVSFTGNFGKNMISPRGLNANLANQLVCIQGIVTRTSIVRPKLVKSYHYCEETKQGTVKDYYDQYSSTNNISDNLLAGGKVLSDKNKGAQFTNNSVPMKDIHGNPLSFEYGLSEFRDFQVILVQEPPERTPLGQLPRSIEVVLQDDLVDKVKPGDRMQIVGLFKCVASQSTSFSGNFKTVLLASSLHSLTTEINVPKISGDDLREIKKIAESHDCLEILSRSLAPSIWGADFIKKALILQLLGGVEKNLENGTHLRGDINIMLIGDPSTAKSQFLRHVLSIAPNSINTTGRGSTGVGLTAAVVVDKDTGERHLEAGAMVLGDRGIVCIDEFDKMNDADRVAIHEVMEQQTVTIAKAGIHVSLNARCSVLAAANPIFGEYQKDMDASKNIGLPDSLLSRFDCVFIVLDENSSEQDRKISDRVIKNHMFPAETISILTGFDDKIIEPDIHLDDFGENQVYEKFNQLLHGKNKNPILTKSFLKKYLFYAKKVAEPALSDEAKDYITKCWTDLRVEFDNNGKGTSSNFYKAAPVTVRTLETLIRLSTAHAKARLSKTVNTIDCVFAEELLRFTYTGGKLSKPQIDDIEEEEEDNDDDDEDTGKSHGSNSKNKKNKKVVISDKKSKKSTVKKTVVDVNINISKSNVKEGSLKEKSKDENLEVTEEMESKLFKLLSKTFSKFDGSIAINDLYDIVKSDETVSTLIINQRHLILVIEKLHANGNIFYSTENEGGTVLQL